MVMERGEWCFRLSDLLGNNSGVLDILRTPEIFFFLLCILPSSGKGSACSSTLQKKTKRQPIKWVSTAFTVINAELCMQITQLSSKSSIGTYAALYFIQLEQTYTDPFYTLSTYAPLTVWLRPFLLNQDHELLGGLQKMGPL